MKAMILGAGKGTRVQPITHEIPKPMIPLVRKPVMAYLVELLKKHGVDEIMVQYQLSGSNYRELFPRWRTVWREHGLFIRRPCGKRRCNQYPVRVCRWHEKIQDFSGFLMKPLLCCAVTLGSIWISLKLCRFIKAKAL